MSTWTRRKVYFLSLRTLINLITISLFKYQMKIIMLTSCLLIPSGRRQRFQKEHRKWIFGSEQTSWSNILSMRQKLFYPKIWRTLNLTWRYSYEPLCAYKYLRILNRRRIYNSYEIKSLRVKSTLQEPTTQRWKPLLLSVHKANTVMMKLRSVCGWRNEWINLEWKNCLFHAVSHKFSSLNSENWFWISQKALALRASKKSNYNI